MRVNAVTMPHPSDGSKTSQLPGRVTDEEYSALDDYAHALNGADPYQNVTKSDVVRWALYRLLLDDWDNLPEEATQKINRDVIEGKLAEKPVLSEGSS